MAPTRRLDVGSCFVNPWRTTTNMEWIWLFLAGCVGGGIDAMVGGGGLITVPALLWTGMPPALALGTNKFQSSIGTTLATVHYARAGLIQGRAILPGCLLAFLAASAGTLWVTRLPADGLRAVIPPVLLVMAAYVAFRPQLGAEPRPARLSLPAFLLLFAPLIGFYDGVFGPGTGSFWMMACVLTRGMTLIQATGHTKAFNLSSNLASLALFLQAGQVDFRVGLCMAAGQLLGAQVGARLVIQRGQTWIRPLFVGMVVLLALRLILAP
jgi:uncharacterized membrane protein YfcA